MKKEVKSDKLASQIAQIALNKKAQEICIMNLKNLSMMTDYFVICHGESEVHVKAIADAILEKTGQEGVRIWHREGYEHLHWVLLDYVDVVVHIFEKETRDFYRLERLWGDAEIKKVKDHME
jgi:ribosome-associated protein